MKKFTELSAVTTLAEDDIVPVVDISETTAGSAKITLAKLREALFNVPDDIDIGFGGSLGSKDVQLRWDTNQTQDAFLIAISGSNNIIVTDQANIDKDHGVGNSSTPKILVYSDSDPEVDADECVTISHSGDKGIIESLTGPLHLGASGGTPTIATNDGDIYIKQKLEVGDDIILINTKNLLLYDANSAYITCDANGFQGMAMLSDVAAPAITIKGFSAYASASSNRNGGDLILQPGANATGGGTDGSIVLNNADGTAMLTVSTDALTPSASSTFALPNFTMAAATDYGISITAAATIDTGRTLYGATHFAQPTVTAASPLTLNSAATVYIENAPAAGGSATITNTYAIQVAAGSSKFGGTVYTDSGLYTSANSGVPCHTYQVGSIGYMQFTGLTDDGMHLNLLMNNGGDNGNLIITTTANRAIDHDHDTLSSHPSVFIHSNLSANIDHSEYSLLRYDGLNPDTWAMETDRATFDFKIRAVSAYASATGDNRNGGDLILQPGANASGGGTDGIVQIWHPDAGAGDYVGITHDATDGRITTGSGTLNIVAAGQGLEVWHIAETANDYVNIYHDAIDGHVASASGDLILTAGGNIRFGTYTVDNYIYLTGYIPIKDEAGNTRWLAVVEV